MPWTIGIVGNAGFQLVMLVLMSASEGRWFLAAVWHATVNAFGSAFFFAMVTGADKDRLGLLLSVAYVLLAVAALALHRHLKITQDPATTGSQGPTPRIRDRARVGDL
jgi:uncharacterized membrane protein